MSSQPLDHPASRWLQLSLGAGIFLAALGTSSANVALPQLAEYFAVSFASVQWVVLAYLLAITVLIVIVGRLSDLYGAKRLLFTGVLVFALASTACAVANSLPVLLVSRFVQGAGAAIMMSLSMALVPTVAPAGHAPRWIGFLASMSAIGTALGPALGGMVLHSLDWRGVFWLNVPFALLTAGLMWRMLPQDSASAAPRLRFDHRGAWLLAAALACYALAMTIAVRWWHSGLLLLLCAGLGWLFAKRQQRLQASTSLHMPLIRLALFRLPTIRQGFVLNMVVMTVMMTTLVVGPFYLAQALGLSASAVGMVMAIGPAITALTAVPLAALSQRVGVQPFMQYALLTMVCGALAMSVVPHFAGTLGYVLALSVLTLGYASFQTANNSAVMTAAAADERGVVAGLLHLARNLGQLTGAAVMGAVFAHAAGMAQLQQASSAQLQQGMVATFGVGAGLLAVALYGVYRAKPHAPGQD